jgi:hypothetical protein
MTPVVMAARPRAESGVSPALPPGGKAAGQAFVLPAETGLQTAGKYGPPGHQPQVPADSSAPDEPRQSERLAEDLQEEDGQGDVQVPSCCAHTLPGIATAFNAGSVREASGGTASGAAWTIADNGVGASASIVDEVLTVPMQRALPAAVLPEGWSQAAQAARVVSAPAEGVRPVADVARELKVTMQVDGGRQAAPVGTLEHLMLVRVDGDQRPEVSFRDRLSQHAFKGEMRVAAEPLAASPGVQQGMTGSSGDVAVVASVAGQVGQAIAMELAGDDGAHLQLFAAANPETVESPVSLVKQLSVRLNPDHLGEVRIKIAIATDGTMLVTLSAVEEQTGELFRQSTGDLLRLLQGHGVDVKSLAVVQPDPGQAAGSFARPAGAAMDSFQAMSMNAGQGPGADGGHDRPMVGRQGAGNDVHNGNAGGDSKTPSRAGAAEGGAIYV